MSTPVLVDMVRTPFGKREGWVSGLHATELLGHVQRGVLDRNGVDPTVVDQAIGGCVTPIGEQFGNITRTSWMHAGLPAEVGCTTIDAQCGTSSQAVQLLLGQVAFGAVDAGVACGVEVMSRVPLTYKQGSGLGTPRPADWSLNTPDQYTAADRIAVRRGFGREDLDAFGVRSQERAAAAWAAGRFDRQVLPVEVPQADGSTMRIERDQGLRASTLEGLAGLKPVKEGGLHTAGTSSQVSDGASAALITSAARAAELGLTPRARVLGQTVVGGDLEYMLDNPILAARKVLDRAGVALADIDVFEVNEAFASVPMSFAQVLEIDPERLNVNGGAIALGHPAGATGIRLLATAVEELERRDAALALVAICASAATTCVLLERL
ncbi:steroid 3-ketoacyl-CoA thiolase [Nocardioides daejeonensis]|uniref:steroid 3-ketoacyl-CoA thiolase n=1 Tax=Nocardioides daejeonensis TaxID=1046556 RepID=UPI000D74039E|nr:steroid 3-ketoacyl-CoA thiolase [Nocardioides daejeonensis]